MRLRVKVNRQQTKRKAEAALAERLADVSRDIGNLLVAQSVRRIRENGDDEITYPDLWADSYSGPKDHYRSGGSPLQDTGALRASLTFEATPHRGGIRIRWGSPLPYARYQHHGFSTSGFNIIPITRRAATMIRTSPGVSPKQLGLKSGVDYIVVRGVTVPARPIVRMSAANRQELKDEMPNMGGR
jgi:phage gpG-like protein